MFWGHKVDAMTPILLRIEDPNDDPLRDETGADSDE